MTRSWCTFANVSRDGKKPDITAGEQEFELLKSTAGWRRHKAWRCLATTGISNIPRSMSFHYNVAFFIQFYRFCVEDSNTKYSLPL